MGNASQLSEQNAVENRGAALRMSNLHFGAQVEPFRRPTTIPLAPQSLGLSGSVGGLVPP
jgi:hypothetical protein